MKDWIEECSSPFLETLLGDYAWEPRWEENSSSSENNKKRIEATIPDTTKAARQGGVTFDDAV